MLTSYEVSNDVRLPLCTTAQESVAMPWGLLCPNLLWEVWSRCRKEELEDQDEAWGPALLTHQGVPVPALCSLTPPSHEVKGLVRPGAP